MTNNLEFEISKKANRLNYHKASSNRFPQRAPWRGWQRQCLRREREARVFDPIVQFAQGVDGDLGGKRKKKCDVSLGSKQKKSD